MLDTHKFSRTFDDTKMYLDIFIRKTFLSEIFVVVVFVVICHKKTGKKKNPHKISDKVL